MRTAKKATVRPSLTEVSGKRKRHVAGGSPFGSAGEGDLESGGGDSGERQVTIRLDTAAVDYFKQLGAELGMPYQNLINLFMRECALQKRRPSIQWPGGEPSQPVSGPAAKLGR